MSVYTTLDRDTLLDYLQPFAVGALTDFRGIEAGVENTNYFITTDRSKVKTEDESSSQGQYVLTLFEYLDQSELDFFVKLQSLMAQHGLPVANPVVDCSGVALKILEGKPALLFPRLPGGHPDVITPTHCSAMGDMLARFHSINTQALTRENHRGLAWLQAESGRLKDFLTSDDYSLLTSELDQFSTFLKSVTTLPAGIIHADLFHDNALFVGDELTGVIDFYNACTGYFLYDLAIMVNDWCVNADGSLDAARFNAMTKAYASVRPFTELERKAWPFFLRAGALRFWVSRLVSLHLPEDLHKKGALTQIKDPVEYKLILKNRLAHLYPLP